MGKGDLDSKHQTRVNPDIAAPPINARYSPESGHWLSVSGCLLCADTVAKVVLGP